MGLDPEQPMFRADRAQENGVRVRTSSRQREAALPARRPPSGAEAPVVRPRRARWVLAVAVVVALAGAPGCATRRGSGFYHEVTPGENLYRIGLRYGVSSRVIAKANRIDDVRSVSVGTRLWIPNVKPPSGVGGALRPPVSESPARPARIAEARRLARLDARRTADLQFAWPLRGRVTSGFGTRGSRGHDGIDVAARKGTPIHAAEAGRVIHSGRLGDYGNVVIVKHAGNYRSVYAHASRLLVRKGEFVEKGERIALVGSTGRSTGPHLHFEIRRREDPRDPMLYLP